MANSEIDGQAGPGVVKVDGHLKSIAFSEPAWEGLVTSVMAEFLRVPWGGPEVGGVLFGAREGDGVRILAHRPLDCEHANGPAFELSEQDEEGLRRLLEEARTDEALAGLEPMGWYLTEYRWLLLSPKDADIYKRHFSAPWQITAAFLRSKTESCMVGLFFWREDGEIGSSHRTFTWREKAAEAAAPVVAQQPEPPAAPIEPAEPPEAEPVEVHAGERTLPVLREESVSPESCCGRLGLTGNPFAQAPDPASAYWGRQHERVLATLLQSVHSRQSPLVITGESGTGKTTLLQHLGDFLVQGSVEFALLLNSRLSVEEFYEFIAYDLDLRCERTSKAAVLYALNNLAMKQGTTVLIVDDAHALEWEVLEEIGLLDNLQSRKGKLIQIILCGRPELDQRLGDYESRGLGQRIALWCRLEPLGEAETIEYVEGQLARYGLERQAIFPRPVLGEIQARSGGILRMTNAICHGLLKSCLAAGTAQATIEMIGEVCASLPWGSGSVPPTPRADTEKRW